MKNKKYYILGGFIFILAISTLIFREDLTSLVTKVDANPDYICIKNVTTGCTISSCGPWENKQRTCIGTTVTQVAYYSLRIGCVESGYSGYKRGVDLGGDSGRHGDDFNYNSTSCSIIQTDNTPPTGEPDTSNE